MIARLRAFALMLRTLVAERTGSTALWFALALPAVMAAAGVAVDYGWANAERHKLQDVADAAATAAARELTFVRPDPTRVAALAIAFAKDHLPSIASTAQFGAQVIDKNTAVTVTISYDAPLPLPITAKSALIGVSATARVSGGPPICVVVLEDKAGNAMYMQKFARMTGDGCAVYSNSKNPTGLRGQDSAKLSAALICSAGGFSGTANFSPQPVTDCPVINDPLADRPAPADQPCTYKNKVLSGAGIVPLSPGVYCGGLTVTNGAMANLSPGIYVIKDGPLKITGAGTLQGTNVGFYLKGDDATIDFESLSTISLTAPKDGALSGLLFFEDRSASLLRDHKILSENARTMLGTVYLSRGSLLIDSNNIISDRSAYTIIVARRMRLNNGPNLVLNTGYDKTDVPVPQGLGPLGGSIFITK